MLSMINRSPARLALVREARISRGDAAQGALRPAVRRYRLARMAPLAAPVATRFAHLRAMHD
jgi:hypothetical protein